MEDNFKLEELFRQELNKINPDAGLDTWDQIAARQQKANSWLRVKRIGRIAVAAAAGVAICIAGWLHFGHKQPPIASTPENTTSTALYTPVTTPVPKAAYTADNTLTPGTETLPQPADATTGRMADGGRRTAATGVYQPFRTRINTVPSRKISFQAEDGLDYTNPETGTNIRIPAGSLVDADGKPVTGKVEFDLWEYRNAADFLSSGIPMYYADARGDYYFNSEGMFDVRVKQHGKELKMAEGRNFEVEMATTRELTQASLYFFDETDGQWKYEPNAAFGSNGESLPPAVSEATAIRDNTLAMSRPAASCLPSIYLPLVNDFEPESYQGLPQETQIPANVKSGIRSGYALATGTESIPQWFRLHLEMTNEKIMSALEQSEIRIVNHHDQLELFFPEDLNHAFYELDAFKDGYFEYSKDRNKKHFDLNGDWQQISIVQQNKEQGSLCMISLFGEKQGLVQFYANLVSSPEHKDFDLEKAFSEYRRLHAKRRENNERDLMRMRKFMFTANLLQGPEEYCMEAKEWLQYFEANKPAMKKRYGDMIKNGFADEDAKATTLWHDWKKRQANMKMSRNTKLRPSQRATAGLKYAITMAFRNFGLHNCDQIFQFLFKGSVESYVSANYQTPDGQTVVPKTVSVFERSTGLYFSLKTNEVPRLWKRLFNLVLTDKQGRTYLVPGERFAETDLMQEKVRFTAEDVTDKTLTPGAWMDLLHI